MFVTADPSKPFGLRHASIVHADSLSLLPLFYFDTRDFSKFVACFDRTGPYCTSFDIESVANLRRSLQSHGSDLIVWIGGPESMIIELTKVVGVEAVYLQREVSRDEVRCCLLQGAWSFGAMHIKRYTAGKPRAYLMCKRYAWK